MIQSGPLGRHTRTSRTAGESTWPPPNMLPKQRRDVLLQWVHASGAVRISEASSELGVSPMTVRRDIGILAQGGLLERVHGGAVGRALRTGGANGTTMGAAAAQFVKRGDCVALAAGDATLGAAQYLACIPDLTVVTNSTRALDVLADTPGSRTLILVGGQRTAWDAVVGPIAEQVIASMHFEVAILGAWGVGPFGLTAPDLAESQTNRRFIEHSQRVVVIAGSAKWGRLSLVPVAAFADLDVVVTDRAPGPSEWFAGTDLAVQVATAGSVGPSSGRPVQPQQWRGSNH